MNYKTERIKWIDIARGICIIAIVLGHVYHYSFIRTYALSFDVPMFFFLSGICYRRPTNMLNYLKKKTYTIVVPYLAFSILSILAFYIGSRIMPTLNAILDCSVKNNILVTLFGNSKPDVMKYNSPLWFLPCFFSVIIISCMLESLILRRERQALARVIVICTLILAGGGISRPEIILPWHIETAVSMLVWYELGILFSRNNTLDYFQKYNESGVVIGLLVLGGLLGFANRYVVKTSLQVRQDIYGVHTFYYLSAFCGIIGFSLLAQRIKNNKVLEYCGRNSLSILVMHKFPVLFFQELLPVTKNLLEDSNTITGICTGIAVAVISIGLSLIVGGAIKHICPFILGEK